MVVNIFEEICELTGHFRHDFEVIRITKNKYTTLNFYSKKLHVLKKKEDEWYLKRKLKCGWSKKVNNNNNNNTKYIFKSPIFVAFLFHSYRTPTISKSLSHPKESQSLKAYLLAIE